jgi:hypothetical protein
MRKLRTIILIAISTCCALAAWSDPPANEKDISVFPGAKLVSEARTPEKATPAELLVSYTLDRNYSTAASADKVTAFFVKLLGVMPEDESADPAPAKFWNTSGVQCIVTFYDGDFIDGSSATVKAAFDKREKLPWAGGLVKEGLFQWTAENDHGEKRNFNLKIEDKSLSGSNPPVYAQQTDIGLSVVMGNPKLYEAQQAEAAEKEKNAAEKITEGLNHQDPAKVAIVDNFKAHPPTAKDLAALVKKEFGVQLYPGAALQIWAMEIYTYDIWGGVGGYWFLSKDLPDKLIAYYEKATGNKQYMMPLDLTHYIDITDKNKKVVGRIAIYQGTTKLLMHQEADDAKKEDVWLVSTLGFYKATSSMKDSGAGR